MSNCNSTSTYYIGVCQKGNECMYVSIYICTNVGMYACFFHLFVCILTQNVYTYYTYRYVYMYVCMYVCMYVYMYECMYVRIAVMLIGAIECIYIHIYIFLNKHLSARALYSLHSSSLLMVNTCVRVVLLIRIILLPITWSWLPESWRDVSWPGG